MDKRSQCVLVVVGVAGLALGAIGGCAEKQERADDVGRGSFVRAADFGGAPILEEPETDPSRPAEKAAKPLETGAHPVGVVSIGSKPNASGASTPVSSKPQASPKLVTSVGNPALSTSAAPTSDPAVTIDAVVGQINGRPVFVSEILEPLDGRLRAAAGEARDGAAWRKTAAEAIVRELQRRIEDELILSEARSALSPEQKAGLFRFLKQIEGQLVSTSQGSEIAADEELRAQTGRGLRAEAEDAKDRALIYNEIRSKVQPRVVVSWRDVQNEYERKAAKYNPPSEYTFRIVYAAADNSASIASIETAIANGLNFDEIAHLPANEYSAKDGGLMKRACDKPQAECEFHPSPELNSALRSIAPGQSLGPIMYPPDKSKPNALRAAWVYLEKIERPEPVSLYDAQLEIENELRVERSDQEFRRYRERLYKRGNVSDIAVMAEKLMAVATDRYAPKFAGK